MYEACPPFRQSPASNRSWAALAVPAAEAGFQVNVVPAQPALTKQHRNLGGDAREAHLAGPDQHMGEARGEGQAGDGLAVRRGPGVGVDRFQCRQTAARLRDGGIGRRVEPGELARIGDAPDRAIQRQRREVGLEDLGRVEAGEAGGRGFFPQAVGHARHLARGAAGALGDGSLARALGDEAGHARRAIIARSPRQTGIDHHRDAVERQAGLGDRGGEHDLAPAVRVGRDGGALRLGLHAAVQAVQHHMLAERVEPFGGALDLGHAGEESEHAAGLLAQRGADRGGHAVLDPRLGGAAEMAQGERVAAAGALDHRCRAHQGRETRAVERGRHRHQTKVGPQRALRVERQREAEITVEAAFVHLVEQHGGHAGQLGIGLDTRDEDALGQHRDTRPGRAFAVHPRGIAIRRSDILPGECGHALGGRARSEAAWREQQYLALAPG